MTISNTVTAGDYNGFIFFKNKKKGLYIEHNAGFFKGKQKIYINKDTVESYEVIEQDTTKGMGSGMLRGAVGAAVLGGVGAIAGANSAKNKNLFTVSIIFKDGTKALCDLDGEMYKNLVTVMY